jgi:PAS domain S-box-containing protein
MNHAETQNYLDIANVIFVIINPDQTIRLINKKGCEVLGFSETELIGKNWFKHFIP